MTPRERLDQLAQLPDGWYDGAGKALDPAGCVWLADMLEKYSLHWWMIPWVCDKDTQETALCAEFLVGKRYFMPEVHLNDRICIWLDFDDEHWLDPNEDDVTGEEFERELDLSDEVNWVWMKERIESYEV